MIHKNISEGTRKMPLSWNTALPRPPKKDNTNKTYETIDVLQQKNALERSVAKLQVQHNRRSALWQPSEL